MHKPIIGLVLLVGALFFLIAHPIVLPPVCFFKSSGGVPVLCGPPNPFSLFFNLINVNPNVLIAGILGIVGIGLILLGSAKRRGAFVLDGGILGFAGYVILGLAVVSLLLGVAIGAALFSGIAIGMPGSQLVLQPWQFALVLAALGVLFIMLGTKHKHRGARA